MIPFVLSRQISVETHNYFKDLFLEIPTSANDQIGLIKLEKDIQVRFKSGEVFFVQLENSEIAWSERLYIELGIDTKIYPLSPQIAAIVNDGIIPRHNDYSTDETVLVNVGIKDVHLTKTLFYYPNETIQIQYEPRQAFVFNPKIDHEVTWRDCNYQTTHRVSLTLKFYDKFDNFIRNLK